MAVAGRRLVVKGGTWTTGLESKKESATERETCLDEEENRRNETWRDGRLERVLTRFERLEADMGLSAGRLTGQDVAAQGAHVAEWLLGKCRVEALWLRVMVVSQVFPGLCCPGLFISFWLQICVRSLETRDSRNKGWPNT